ncbi:MAG: hypothetical protein ACI38Q_05065 [Candidatus Bruticola sp.]
MEMQSENNLSSERHREEQSESVEHKEKLETEVKEGSSEESDTENSTFWTPANIAGIVFVVLLVAFNLVIYSGALDNLGKGESSRGPGLLQSGVPNQPEPVIVADAPPPPSEQVSNSSLQLKPPVGVPSPPAVVPGSQSIGPSDTKEITPVYPKQDNPKPLPVKRAQAYGTQVLSGFIYFYRCPDPELRLSKAQISEGTKILSGLEQDIDKTNRLINELMSYFTDEQIKWARSHRGEPNLIGYKSGEKSGYQPVVAKALEVLARGAGLLKARETYSHKFVDFQIQDIASMIVKMEDVETLKMSAGQRAAVAPLLRELADLDKKRENTIRKDIGELLNDRQLAWMEQNVDRLRVDYHSLLTLYALEIMKSGASASSDSEAAPKVEKGK